MLIDFAADHEESAILRHFASQMMKHNLVPLIYVQLGEVGPNILLVRGLVEEVYTLFDCLTKGLYEAETHLVLKTKKKTLESYLTP